MSIVENKEIAADAKIYGYLLTAIYMFLANILLLNLLIAMFSNTFNNVEQNANEIWKFNNFRLIYSYRLNELPNIKLWPAPPPFNLINLPVFFFKLLNIKKGKYDKIDTESINEEYIQIVG